MEYSQSRTGDFTMRCIVTCLILLFIMIREYKKHKHILCASVVYPVLWIFSLLGLLLTDRYYTVSFGMLSIIVIGYLLFCVGFNACNKRGYVDNIYNAVFDDRNISEFGMKIAFVISLIIGLIYLFKVRNYISLTSFTISLSMIRSNTDNGNLTLPLYLLYLSGMVQCSMRIFLFVYLRNKQNGLEKNNVRQVRLKNRVIILFLLSLVILLTNFSRNALLFFGLSIITIWLITKKISGKKIAFILGILFVAFIGVFIWFSMFRDAYKYVNGNIFDTAFESLIMYLSGGVIAYDQSIQTGLVSIFAFNGINHTFAIFTSIVDMLFETSITPGVVLDSIKIGPSSGTNVYTVYYWTALDLGVVYSLLCQLFYGFLHGYFYRGVRHGSLRHTYWYCMIFYSLIMMFFEEQYFSIGQSWLLRIIAYLVIGTLCGITRFKFGKKKQ